MPNNLVILLLFLQSSCFHQNEHFTVCTCSTVSIHCYSGDKRNCKATCHLRQYSGIQKLEIMKYTS